VGVGLGVLGVAFISGCAAQGAAAPTDGWAVLAAHLEAIGGRAAVEALPGLRLAGTVTATDQPGLAAPFETAWHDGGDYRSLVSFPGGFPLAEGLSGDLPWARDPGARRLRGDDASELRRRADRHAAAHPERWWSSAEVDGYETVSGRPAWRVRLAAHEGRTVERWFDAENWLILGSRSPGALPGTEDQVWVSDWRPVGGVLVPHVQTQDQDGFLLLFTVASADLAPGPPLAVPEDVQALLDPAGPVGETALSWWRGLPVIDVRVGGVTVPMVVDTGANTTVVDPALVPGDGALRVPGGGAGGPLPDIPLRAVGDLSIGGRVLPNRVAAAADLVGLFGVDGPRGILGADVLGEHVLEIDPAQKRVRLFPAGATGPDPTGLVAIPVERFAGGLLKTVASLAGSGGPTDGSGRPIGLLVDTGGERTVLSWHAVNPLGLLPGAKGTRRIGEAVGADGHLTPVYEAALPGLQVGALRRAPGSLAVANLPAARRLLGEGAVGVLGVDLLLQGRLIVDAPGGTVWVQPAGVSP
jgi:hypothetical protein